MVGLGEMTDVVKVAIYRGFFRSYKKFEYNIFINEPYITKKNILATKRRTYNS